MRCVICVQISREDEYPARLMRGTMELAPLLSIYFSEKNMSP